MKTVYNIKLHESLIINENIQVLRVPGGWIYTLPDKSPVLIDFSSEFQFTDIKRNVDPLIVIEVVRQYFNLHQNFIKIFNRYGNIPLAKKFIVDILMNYSSLNYVQVAELMNYKSVSSVVHARKTLNNLIFSDKTIEIQFTEVLKALYLK